MNKKILFLVVVVGVIAITIYNFRGTSTITEGYEEQLLAKRAETNIEFKEAED